MSANIEHLIAVAKNLAQVYLIEFKEHKKAILEYNRLVNQE